MRCPFCQHDDSRVLDSRVCEDGTAIRRRRQCPMCERRFTTIERMQMTVHKRNGIEEPFSRDKVIRGVRNACKGRPVTDADLALLGQRVEDGLRARGVAEIPSEEIGLAILGPLRELDPIAYLRFASVYLTLLLRLIGCATNPPIKRSPRVVNGFQSRTSHCSDELCAERATVRTKYRHQPPVSPKILREP